MTKAPTLREILNRMEEVVSSEQKEETPAQYAYRMACERRDVVQPFDQQEG